MPAHKEYHRSVHGNDGYSQLEESATIWNLAMPDPLLSKPPCTAFSANPYNGKLHKGWTVPQSSSLLASMRLDQLLTAFFAVPTTMTQSTEPVAGGYSLVSVDDVRVASAANFAINFAIRARPEASAIRLLDIVHAHRQVVAGDNYLLQLRVSDHGQIRLADVVVFEPLPYTGQSYELTSWHYK